MIRVINNKKLNLTNDEFLLYQKICKSYDTPKFKGEDLFKDLFETDENGIIVFLKPPTTSYTSMEVWMFLVSVMIHQHIGTACQEADFILSKVKNEFETLQSEKIEVLKIKSLIEKDKKELIEKNSSILSDVKSIVNEKKAVLVSIDEAKKFLLDINNSMLSFNEKRDCFDNYITKLQNSLDELNVLKENQKQLNEEMTKKLSIIDDLILKYKNKKKE